MTGSVTGIRRRRTVAGRRETSHLPPDRAFYGQTLIRSKGAIKPRSDSPREVNVFEISVDGNVIAGSRNQAINLFTVNGFHFLVPSSPDSIRKLQWSDHE